jgi:NADPH-dependent 2,4-dienoyl-CoA reductase/sulfur reductase-like enzyme/nitrite reductase/ring-hydroxylating ferredoxin subunit
MGAAPPDLELGIGDESVPDGGVILGRVHNDDVVVARQGNEVFAVGASCTHYHGNLAEGLLVGTTLRCPLHHACFNLRTGVAERAPALDPIACYRVERRDGKIFVREKVTAPPPAGQAPLRNTLRSVVIIGGGAAGLVAAATLRQEGFAGSITLVSADDAAPYDRPNLSKDYLAGNAPEEWMPLRAPEFYSDNRIELALNARAASLDVTQKRVVLEDGRHLGFEGLLIATGAEPVRLPIPGATPDNVRYLRSFADSRAIIARAATAKRVIVLGTSFIGLEVAASLRARGITVEVVGLESVPMARILGTELGQLVKSVHEQHGVDFHLETSVAGIADHTFTLANGTRLEADFLVAGVGVRPVVALAEKAGLATDSGVLVDENLQTSASGIFAAGDIARWPDPHSGERIRVEHWVVAERQGRIAARNLLGCREKFDAVPFFWSQHYDMTINYVGHAESWDRIRTEGDLSARDCTLRYERAGRTLAVATLARDRVSLEAEVALESRRNA